MKLYTTALLFAPVFSKSIQNTKDCLINPTNPSSYTGHRVHTENGEACASWFMYLNDDSFSNYNRDTVDDHSNYCRFPSDSEFSDRKRPWCFIEKRRVVKPNEKVKFENVSVGDTDNWSYCNISNCDRVDRSERKKGFIETETNKKKFKKKIIKGVQRTISRLIKG